MRFIQHLSQEGASQTDRQHARDKTSEPKTRVRCTRNTWRYESGTSATRCIKRSKQESKIWPWRSHFLSFICPFSYLRESKWSSRCSMSTFIYLNVHVRCMDIQLMGSACVFSFTSRFLMEKTAWNKNENEKKLSNLLVFQQILISSSEGISFSWWRPSIRLITTQTTSVTARKTELIVRR